MTTELLVLATARARGIALPADDAIAQTVLDQTEAELARIIGPLTGARTETFYVGFSASGKLSLSRYTNLGAIEVFDNSVQVAADQIRLIDRGSAIARDYHASSWWWTGPYVAVTYAPDDTAEVTAVAYQMLALSANPALAAGGIHSETIGDYSYTLGGALTSPQRSVAARRALAKSLLPPRDMLHNVRATRLDYPAATERADINAPEAPL